jgi:Uma2 family endonuclease
MTALQTRPAESVSPESFVLSGVSWKLYEMLLREVEEQHIYITYDRGRTELMSPRPEHEHWKKIIGRFIEILTLELGISISSFGSTTFRHEGIGRGLEPGECYYLEHESAVRGKKRLDLKRDPPPDLVVEIDITHRAIDREEIYAALGVPEIWRFDGHRLEGLRLGKDGRYRRAAKSLALPFLRLSDVERFLKKVPDADETSVMREFRDWVRTIVR